MQVNPSLHHPKFNMETTTIKESANTNTVKPLFSINSNGYQRTTLPGRKTIYPLNLRVDQQAHDHLKSIQAYYDRITGLKVRPSVIMRRAIEKLADHIGIADPSAEQAAIVKCSHMGGISHA